VALTLPGKPKTLLWWTAMTVVSFVSVPRRDGVAFPAQSSRRAAPGR
jgi:hypothetical protein